MGINYAEYALARVSEKGDTYEYDEQEVIDFLSRIPAEESKHIEKNVSKYFHGENEVWYDYDAEQWVIGNTEPKDYGR